MVISFKDVDTKKGRSTIFKKGGDCLVSGKGATQELDNKSENVFNEFGQSAKEAS